MIDKVKITIKSGNGGDGAVSGRHEKFVPRGGPDGGDGGKGGDIVVIGDTNENTLLGFRYKRNFVAGHGGNGAGAKKHGADGKDVLIPVPIGTQIVDHVPVPANRLSVSAFSTSSRIGRSEFLYRLSNKQ